MRFRSFIIAIVVIAAVLLVGGIYASATSAPPEPHTPVATVQVTTGEAFLLKKGTNEWVSVGSATELAPGDRVRTGAGSAATMEFFDQSTARLDADTEIEIEALSVDPDNTTSQTVDFAVITGRVWSRIIKFLDKESSYSVETSTLVATVRGTAFIVDARIPEAHRVVVAENTVGVSLVQEPDVVGGRRTLSAPVDVSVGDEVVPEIETLLGRPRKRLRVRKLLEVITEDPFIKEQLEKDDDFLERVIEARERRLEELSSGGLPGSPGYPLKRVGERLRTSLTTDPEERRELRHRYADRRFAEAVSLSRLGRRAKAEGLLREYYGELLGRLEEIDPDSTDIPRERAGFRLRKIRGQLLEHQDLIRELDLGDDVKEFYEEFLNRDAEIGRLKIQEFTEKLEDSYQEPEPVFDEPLYDPATVTEPTPEAVPVAPTTEQTPDVPKAPKAPEAPTTEPQPAPTPDAPVAPVVTSLDVVGTRTIMSVPDTQQFRAFFIYSDNSTKDVTELAAWSLEGSAIGTIKFGFLTTDAEGSATVVANLDGFRGSYALMVKPPLQQPVLERVSASCLASTVTPGSTTQCSATAHYTDGTSKTVTTIAAWSVTNLQAGRVSATGLFTAGSTLGVTDVVASYADGDVQRSGSFTISVTITGQ